jgi:hypothetical protein
MGKVLNQFPYLFKSPCTAAHGKKWNRWCISVTNLLRMRNLNTEMVGNSSYFSPFHQQPRSGLNINNPVQGATSLLILILISLHRRSGIKWLLPRYFGHEFPKKENPHYRNGSRIPSFAISKTHNSNLNLFHILIFHLETIPQCR